MNFKEKLQQSVTNSSSFSLSWTATSTVDLIISKTFFWMWLVLLTVFGVAYYTYILVLQWMITLGGLSMLSLISIILWFVLVIIISYSWQKLSYGVLATLLLVFGVFEWFWLSGIFLTYSMGSIISIFLTTSIMFFLLAIAWHYMKVDVAKWWVILMAGLLAIIIWFIINIFWKNSWFNLILNIIWLIVFSAFVIYDLNVLKLMAQSGDRRIELVMALSLFLTFINIFMILLRLFGSRD